MFGFSFCLNQNNFRYVDTHWIPLRVSTTNNQTGQIISNVTGVFGGWIFIDRFPMPPAHGRLTNVRQSFVFDLLSINIISSTLICLTFKLTDMFVLVVMSSLSLISHLSSLSLSLSSLSLSFPFTQVPAGQSIFSNDVAVDESMAFQFRDSLVGNTYPCLVPKGASIVQETERDRSDCSSGMYPYEWAMNDLLKNGGKDRVCSQSCVVIFHVLERSYTYPGSPILSPICPYKKTHRCLFKKNVC